LFGIHHMFTVAITGANGFIGRNLVQYLTIRGDVQIRVLVRDPHSTILQHANVTLIQGDLASSGALKNFLVPGCTVINLAYDSLAPQTANLAAMRNLAEACGDSHVRRMIHCSTAVVFGRCAEEVVNEKSACEPQTEYGNTKLLIEQALREYARGRFETVMLRPTAVFGPGGQALVKLANDLLCGSRAVNYLRSCLFNERKMNLVCVNNVTAAIMFLAETRSKVDGEVYIISEDDNPSNNFRYVEQYLLAKLGRGNYVWPRLSVPPMILSWLLRTLGRDVDKPRRIYDSSKIRRAGFCHVEALEHGLAVFVEWYRGKSGSGQPENK
jgi:nucleoside-diphosphate-sugar epimerase